MSKLPEVTIIFKANSYDNDESICKMYGDSDLIIKRYPKDRSFKQMRRDMFFTKKSYSQNDLRIFYKKSLENNSLHNQKLSELFTTRKKIWLSELLEKFITNVDWLNPPTCLKIDMTNAQIIGSYYDGNEQKLLCEDQSYFYYVSYGGS